MTPRWPDTFVVGAPRCGTSAMHTWLAEHPQVFMSRRKEPLFFATDLTGLPGRRIDTEEEYLALFSEATDERRVGESSPYYLYSAHAAEAIGRRCRDARIIIMLRNPADMMHSMYWAWSYGGFEERQRFVDALRREHEERQAVRFILRYRTLARYAGPVERYVNLFGPSRVHVIIFDDLVRDPSVVYRDVCRFLDVSVDHRPRLDLNAFDRAASRRPLSRRLLRLVSPAGPAPADSAALRAVGFIRDIVRRWGSLPPPRMEPDLRQQLLREFGPDIRRLSEVIGRDLSRWER